jgi:ABC-type nitrate/sulfonate/bicarbonate transport system substrate-binding protein
MPGFARAVAAIAAVAWLSIASAHAQQKTEVTISRAYGLIYMATDIIEKRRLIEKHAAALGIPDLKVNWVTFSGGGAQTDALLAGKVDIVNSGIGNLLLLWDRTKGGVKGIVGTSALPLDLISRDPRIKSLKDIGPNDKIAVPTVKVSTHAVLLEIAAAKLWGPDQWERLDANTVQLGHAEAVAALANPRHEVATHFSAPPYQYFELKNIPGAHVILRSDDIAGGPVASAQMFTTTRYANATDYYLPIAHSLKGS